MSMANSMLETDFDGPYNAWKQDPSPDNKAAILKTLDPTIQGAIRVHVGAPNPLLVSRARRMALEGLRGYDPARGRLQTHLYSHLQGLKRANRQQTQILKVPERISFDRQRLEAAEQEMVHELGRDPTDAELTNKTGFSAGRIAKVRTYRPAVAEGTLDDAETGAGYGGAAIAANRSNDLWRQVIYDDLDSYHQKIMEHSLGLNGRPVLPNHVLAAKLRRSPGAISQAKLRIQRMLDEGDELSPF